MEVGTQGKAGQVKVVPRFSEHRMDSSFNKQLFTTNFCRWTFL